MEKREPSYIVGGNANLYNHYGEQCGDSSKKLETELPFDPTKEKNSWVGKIKHIRSLT